MNPLPTTNCLIHIDKLRNGLTATLTYDPIGRLSLTTLPNGTTTERTWDSAEFLASVISKKSGVAFDTHTFLTDSVGNITQETVNGVVNSFGYDDLYRLTSATVGGTSYSWTYDNTGNRLSQTVGGQTTSYTYLTPNRLSTVGGTSLTYDKNGNILTYGGDTYGWDVRGRMTSLSRTGLSASFSYDTFGRRTSKTVSGVATSFLYDNSDVVQETSGASVFSTLYGPQTDQPLARNGVYYNQNAQGSAAVLTDGSGNSVQQYSYTPFGETSQSTGVSNPYQYASRENDGTGLYYNRARYYAPSLGRFMSPDPVGFAGGLNAYAYCGNDPVNFTDPSGCLTVQFGGYKFGSGDPDLAFDSEGADEGIRTGLAATFSAISMGLYDGGAYRCKPGFGTAHLLAEVGVTSIQIAAGLAEGRALAAARETQAVADVGDAAELCNAGCFTAGTPVQMADGSTKPIEEVQPGDLVLSRSEKSNADGKVVAARVTSTTQREHAGTLVLHLASGQTVETTPEHLFFVDGKGFVPAGRLAIGNAIVTRAGPAVKLERVEHRSAAKKVYNFEVGGTHTYFVGKIGYGIWVHNECPLELQFMHSEETLRSGANYQYLQRQSTEDLLSSLKPGATDQLKVYSDGIIADGNTRLRILLDRGIDINSLPRVIEPRTTNFGVF